MRDKLPFKVRSRKRGKAADLFFPREFVDTPESKSNTTSDVSVESGYVYVRREKRCWCWGGKGEEVLELKEQDVDFGESRPRQSVACESSTPSQMASSTCGCCVPIGRHL